MEIQLFQNLSEEEKKEVAKFLPNPLKKKKGVDIYKSGYLSLLVNGKATIRKNDKNGDGINIRSIYSGECFGSASVFGSWEDGRSSAITQTECEVIYIEEKAVKKMFLKFPQISLNYITFLTDRVRFLNKRIDSFTSGSTENRLYDFLLNLADRNGVCNLDFSLAELSRRLQVGRSSLYRDIHSLEQSGLLKRERRTFILK